MQDAWLKTQPHLAGFLNSKIPTVVALIGESGCGKHKMCDSIATKLSLEIQDISDCISEELIESLYLTPVRKLYLVEVVRVLEKWQNALLKMLEEPPQGSTVVLLVESETQLIDTLASRCFKLHFWPYSADQLKEFAKRGDWSYYRFCTTPG